MPKQVVPRPGARRPDLIFCATGKSGLGHLRRIANIVTALVRLRPGLDIHLVSNAAVGGLSQGEARTFAAIHTVDRLEMAAAAAELGPSPVVVDTAVLPGLESTRAPLCLILRETVAEKLAAFNLPGDRPWDLVCVPNPESHWLPAHGTINARKIVAAGWIFRPVPAAAAQRMRLVPAIATVLAASGGGGNPQTAAWYKATIDAVLERARRDSPAPFRVVQVVGPRMGPDARLSQADEHVTVDSRLNEEFARYDAVISTAGYNSVLELAQTDVPVLLVPILRSLDDQAARARGWAAAMGHAHEEADPAASARWLVETLHARKRRQPSVLQDGAETCARQILGMLQ